MHKITSKTILRYAKYVEEVKILHGIAPKYYRINIWNDYRSPRLDNDRLNINDFIIHENRNKYTFHYIQVQRNSVQHTQI